MLRQIAIGTLALGLSGCATDAATSGGVSGGFDPAAISYEPLQTTLLDGDLVSFDAQLSGAEGPMAVEDYARCAAAQYALIRGFSFARLVRNNVTFVGGVWRADAVYTISPVLPAGATKIDAEVTVADCASRGVPTV